MLISRFPFFFPRADLCFTAISQVLVGKSYKKLSVIPLSEGGGEEAQEDSDDGDDSNGDSLAQQPDQQVKV